MESRDLHVLYVSTIAWPFDFHRFVAVAGLMSLYAIHAWVGVNSWVHVVVRTGYKSCTCTYMYACTGHGLGQPCKDAMRGPVLVED